MKMTSARARRLTLVWQTKLFHTGHVHFELALIREEVLAVAGSAIALIGAAGCRLWSMVFIWGGRPFLARLSN